MRLNLVLENKIGQICLNQIRFIDKIRLKNRIDILLIKDIEKLKNLLKEYLVE